MNLKFQRVDWDNNLMYVELETDGQKMRWYPKWKDVDDILRCAWLTEHTYQNSRWGDYFDIVCSEILLKGLLRRLARDPNFSEFVHADVSVSNLFQALRNVILTGG